MRKIVSRLIRGTAAVATAIPLLLTNIPHALADTGWLYPVGDYSIEFNKVGFPTYNYQVIDDTICNAGDYIWAEEGSYGTHGLISYTDQYYVNLSTIPNGTEVDSIRVRPCAAKRGSSSESGHLVVAYIILTPGGGYCAGGADELYWSPNSTSFAELEEKKAFECFPFTKQSNTSMVIMVHYDNMLVGYSNGLKLSRLRFMLNY